jgi:hypothetical protein
MALTVATLTIVAGCGGFAGTGSPAPTGTVSNSTTPRSASPTDRHATDTATPTKASTSRPTPETTTSAPTGTTPTARPTTAPSGTTTTPERTDLDDVSIPVRGTGSLPFDVNRTYRRTMKLLGNPAGVDPPDQIYLYRPNAPWKPTVQDPFARTLLDARRESNFTRERHDGVVLGVTDNESPDVLRFTIVHEFVHNAQFEHVQDTSGMEAAFADEHQRSHVGVSLLEGGASYVATQYMRQYTDRNESWLRNATDQYLNASPAGKYVWAPYHFGHQYVAARADDPIDHWRRYRNPPNTTEAIVHGLAPGSEPPAALSMTVETDRYEAVGRESRGEMFVRVVLAAELHEKRAARGASGWGNDVLVTLEGSDRQGFAWATRWDSAPDATEFVETFRAAMDRRGDRRAGYWIGDGAAIRVVRVAPETVVIVTGPRAFVTEASVSGHNSSVTVSTP